MTSLSLSLGPAALVRLHDVLICLAKFSETVAIEAEPDLVGQIISWHRYDGQKSFIGSSWLTLLPSSA
jgi:hypothetical protein